MDYLFYLEMISRLLLACILGGIIGYEREHMRRPAGFRTHILVCVGSALVMVTSEFIFNRFAGIAGIDPTRLGAQVISGIGFLGAGTILVQGINVKGLTTAASLWTVSCVGIAVGIGFYEGAVAATIIIFLTLIVLKKLELQLSRRNRYEDIYVQSYSRPGQLGNVSGVLEGYGVQIVNIEVDSIENEKSLLIKFTVKIPEGVLKGNIINDIHNLEGVQKIF